MQTQENKGIKFRKLHERPSAFIIPNPWDVGTAKVLAGLGFEALATTSAGFAFSIGKRACAVGRDKMIAHVREIVEATDLPVSADLENGFGDDPQTVGRTIQLAAAAGLVGGSIEDSTQRKDDPIYEQQLAVDRIRAAVEVARIAAEIPHALRTPAPARPGVFSWVFPAAADPLGIPDVGGDSGESRRRLDARRCEIKCERALGRGV